MYRIAWLVLDAWILNAGIELSVSDAMFGGRVGGGFLGFDSAAGLWRTLTAKNSEECRGKPLGPNHFLFPIPSPYKYSSSS